MYTRSNRTNRSNRSNRSDRFNGTNRSNRSRAASLSSVSLYWNTTVTTASPNSSTPQKSDLLHDALCCMMLYRALQHIMVAKCRLQHKRVLFWYRHHPKMHEMVSDRISRAENWTDLRKISRRVFFDSKKNGKNMIWSKQMHKGRFS